MLLLCAQFQRSAAAHHSHVGVQCVSCGNSDGHRTCGSAQYSILSSSDVVRLVHHAVQPQSRLCEHITLHPRGCLPTVSTANRRIWIKCLSIVFLRSVAEQDTVPDFIVLTNVLMFSIMWFAVLVSSFVVFLPQLHHSFDLLRVLLGAYDAVTPTTG